MRCIYIYNPYSGKRKHMKLKHYIISKLKSKFKTLDVYPTDKKGDATKFASEACGKYDIIVVAGGDGTLNEVINGIANKPNRPKIGYIPTGTTNDLARSLKIPRNIKKALKIILNENSTKHDIFKSNNKYGIYVCAFGIFTASSYTTKQSEKNKIGQLAYYFSGIKEIATTKHFPLTLKTTNLQFTTDIILAIITNGKYCSGFKINEKNNYKDGYVNLILFKEKNKKSISLSTLLNIVKLFLFGVISIKKVKNCSIIKLDKCSIELNNETPVNIDGEYGFSGSFDFEVLKEHIEIFIK